MATLKDYVAALAMKVVNVDLGGKGATGSPSYIKLIATDGTARYLFVETDGTVKVHNAVPTQDSDGSEVGGQS